MNTKADTLSLEQIALALDPFYRGLSAGHLAAIREYVDLLVIWNRTVNLTALSDPSEIVTRHFGESLFAASMVGGAPGRLADVGSGAGFPGLPLKIIFPRLGMVLLESNSRKCAFLAEIRQKLSLEDIEIARCRYEESQFETQSFDFVCSRALGDYRRLLRWARSVIKPDGRIILWLGTEDSTRLSRTGDWLWDLPVKIPESRRRVVLVGKPAL